MSEKEQIKKFADAVDNLVDQFRSEWDLTYGAAIGVLTMKIHTLCKEAEDRKTEVE